MIQQIYYEFRKHFIKLPVFAALAVFLLLNAIQISSAYRDKSVFSMIPEWKADYDALYPVYGGSITEEKIKDLMARYRSLQAEGIRHPGSEYQDALMLQICFIRPMQYDYEYRQNASRMVGRALENVEFYQRAGNDYARRQNEQIAALFSGRWIPELRYTEMYQHYLQYDFSVFLVLLICIYGLVNVFVLEKETEMELILRTTVQGMRRSAAAKLLAAVLFTTGVSLLFWVSDFVLFGCLFGSFDGGSCPVYAIEYFEASPLSMSLFSYALVSMALKTTAVLLFGMVVLFLSCLCKNALLPFVGSILVIGGCLLAYAADLPSLCNPVHLLVCREMFHWVDFINLGGASVLTWQVCLGTALFTLAVLIVVILYTAGKGGAVRGHNDL